MDMNKQDNQDLKTREQLAFEDWYVHTTFDLNRSPIGSRDCFLQRRAWEAATQYLMSTKPREVTGQSTPGLNSTKSSALGSSVANVKTSPSWED